MNPDQPTTNGGTQPASEPTVPTMANEPVASQPPADLGVTPAPTNQGVPSPTMPTDMSGAQSPLPTANASAAGGVKSKLPFLLGVGLVVIVLIAVIVFLAL